MTREEFAEMAWAAVEIARGNAEAKLGKALNRDAMFKFYGKGANGIYVSFDELIDRTFISEDSFYRLIDLMVIEIAGERPVIFTRVSGHPPGPLSECWNGLRGPFKQLIAYEIPQLRPH